MEKHVETISGTNIKAKIKYSPDEWNKKLEETYRMLGRQVQIKGFRKGKAPLNILKMYIPEDYVEEEVKKTELDNIVKMLLEDGYKIVGIVSAEWSKEDELVLVEIVAETYPEVSFDEINWSEIDIETLDDATVVPDEEVDKAIRGSLEPYFSIEKTADKEVLEEGDIALVEWRMIVGGKETPKREITFVVGSGEFIEEVEPHLVGMKRDEKRYILVNSETNEASVISSPDDVPSDDFYVVEVVLKDIRTKEMEVTDEVAQKLGYDSVEALRSAVKENIQRAKWEQWRDRVLSKLADLVKLEIPQSMIIDEVNARYKGLRKEASKAKMEWEEYLAKIGFENEDKLIDKLKEVAEETLKFYILTLSLAKYFGIDENDEAMEEKVIRKIAELIESTKKQTDIEENRGES